jgi:hypothetical protein
MAATILGAIHGRWDADTALGVGGIRLFNDDGAPEGTTLGSYVSLEGFAAPERLLDSSGKKFIEATWDFVAHVEGTQEAEGLAELIRMAFNRQALGVDGMKFLLMIEVDYSVSLDRTRSTEARRVTEMRASYLAQLTRP